MTIKEILKNSQTVLFMRIVHEKLLEVPLLAKYIANGNRMGDKDKLLTKAKLSFGEFSQSRHSIRDFGEKPVNIHI